MSTWGADLFDEDVALDTRDMFREAVEAGLDPRRAAAQVLGDWGEAAEEPDDGPVIRLALAVLLLDAGVRAHPILDEAREVLRAGAGLERWAEGGEAVLKERRAVYDQLAARLDAAG